MSQPRVIRYDSVAALRTAADAWDDLWQRSDATLPTGRAELIAQWIDEFAPHDRFVAIAIEQDGQLIAALPLLARRVAKIIPVGSFPRNDWLWAGDLLLDPTADAPAALAILLAEIRRASWPLLWFDAVPLESYRWRAMLAALNAAGLGHAQHPRFVIGTVEIADQLHRDWNAYQELLADSLHRQLDKARRRAAPAGLELDLRRPQHPDEVAPLMREGFEVEHRSWKGRDRSSVLANPAICSFHLRQATQIVRWGQLELAFLRHNGQAIAFEYAWFSKGIYFSPKVGYDDSFSRLSPGQVLRYKLLQHCFANSDYLAMDFCGPLNEACAKWTTHTYPISRLVVETGALRAKSLLWAYNQSRTLRHRHDDVTGADLDIINIAASGTHSPLSVAISTE